VVEGFRPGVAERLGIGPRQCAERNPRLVYGRVTGWGQEGPRSGEVGHDIDYIAIAGALHPIGQADAPPPPPLNLIADFGGGGMLLVAGVLAALVERAGSGAGQVVDAAMVDGAALLMAMPTASPLPECGRSESNLLDGGRPSTGAIARGRSVHGGGGHRAEVLRRSSCGLGLDGSDLPVNTTGPGGRCCGIVLPQCLRPSPATSGRRCLPEPRPVSPRC
jgi:alpha-methylacyl-CoA racemase